MKRPKIDTAALDGFLTTAEAGLNPLSDALPTPGVSDDITAEVLRAAHRRLVLLARDANVAACMLYNAIATADSRAEVAKLSAR